MPAGRVGGELDDRLGKGGQVATDAEIGHHDFLGAGVVFLSIERQPDPNDARARLVALSADGTARMTEATAARRARLSEVLDRWDDADLETLARLLDRLNTDME